MLVSSRNTFRAEDAIGDHIVDCHGLGHLGSGESGRCPRVYGTGPWWSRSGIRPPVAVCPGQSRGGPRPADRAHPGVTSGFVAGHAGGTQAMGASVVLTLRAGLGRRISSILAPWLYGAHIGANVSADRGLAVPTPATPACAAPGLPTAALRSFWTDDLPSAAIRSISTAELPARSAPALPAPCRSHPRSVSGPYEPLAGRL